MPAIRQARRRFARADTLPLCQQTSIKVHSRYQRSLDDLLCCGKQLRLLVLVQRFFCLNQECARRLFVKRVSEVAIPFARKTNRLNQTLQTIGLALGGGLKQEQRRSESKDYHARSSWSIRQRRAGRGPAGDPDRGSFSSPPESAGSCRTCVNAKTHCPEENCE